MEMTKRERMMNACRRLPTDRVPVAPDISNMVPARMTGKPFWDIYYRNDPPLWKAYLDAAEQLDIDAWFIEGTPDFIRKTPVEYNYSTELDSEGRMIRTTVVKTAKGDLVSREMCRRDDPPVPVEKLIKDFKEDFPKIKCMYSEIVGVDTSSYKEKKAALGERGMMGAYCTPPGLHTLEGIFEGNLMACTYAYYDYPELFEELCELITNDCVRQMEFYADMGIDSILTGGSGSITLQSPEIWEQLSLPGIKKITAMCRQAGIISGIHSCGKEMHLIKTCYEQTDLDYLNPLELPPMGDCTLKECKERFGDKLCLMGNLHTTNTMLLGSPDKVKLESLKAIRDAGVGGGFILSTGDQCPRDTSDDNFAAMVNAVKEYGTYPLNIDRIESEIERLERKTAE